MVEQVYPNKRKDVFDDKKDENGESEELALMVEIEPASLKVAHEGEEKFGHVCREEGDQDGFDYKVKRWAYVVLAFGIVFHG